MYEVVGKGDHAKTRDSKVGLSEPLHLFLFVKKMLAKKSKNIPRNERAFRAANFTDCTSHLLRYNSWGTASLACRVHKV